MILKYNRDIKLNICWSLLFSALYHYKLNIFGLLVGQNKQLGVIWEIVMVVTIFFTIFSDIL